MTVIKKIKKYSLEDESFVNGGTLLDNHSFSVVRKKVICDESNSSFDMIIFVNGNQAIDVTKDGVHPYGQRDYVERICQYFQRKKKNVIVEHILLDEDAPLALEARMIANHIDVLSSNQTINSIQLIGHSKGGTISFNVPKSFKKNSSYQKTSITTTATPFLGCLLASPKFFLKKVREVIYSQLPEPVSKYTYDALVTYYSKMNRESHMNNDIALEGYSAEHYDPDFIAGMFDLENIEAMKKVHYYQNFVTGIDDQTMLDSLNRKDFTSVGMCLMDRYFMDEITDGFVEVRSQESISKHMDVVMRRLQSRTHYFLSHDDDLDCVLDTINDVIDDYNEKNKRPNKY